MRPHGGWMIGGALLLGLSALAGCSNEPFVVAPPTAKPGDIAIAVPPRPSVFDTFPEPSPGPGLGPFDYDPRPRRIALCYSSQLNTPAQVIARARELCPQHGKIALEGQDVFLNDCSLFQPYRVTFRCTPGPAPEAKYK
jgi:hypothetical protein